MKLTGLSVGYLFALIVTQNFGAETWGEYSLALSLILFFSILGPAGLDTSIVKTIAGQKKKSEISSSYRPALIGTLAISTSLSILFYICSHLIAENLFMNPEMSIMLNVAAFAILPLSLINLNAGTLQGMERISRYIFLRFPARHISSLLILLLLMMIGSQSTLVILSYVSGLWLVTFLSFYWLLREGVLPFRRTTEKYKSRDEYIKLYKLSFPLMLAGSLIFLNGWIDTIMLGAYLPESEVGIYNISLKLSTLLLLGLSSVNVVVTPKFSEFYSKRKIKELREVVHYSTAFIFYLSLPVFIVLVLFPEQILSLFGEEFIEGKYALIILSAGSMFSALAGSTGSFMQMTGSQVAFQNITIFSFLLALILNVLLIPLYGIEGAAGATGISTIFWNSAAVYVIRKKYKIFTFYRPKLGRKKN